MRNLFHPSGRSIAGRVFLCSVVGWLAASTAWADSSCPANGQLIWDHDTLEAAKASIASGNTDLKPALDALRKEAAAAREAGPWSVTAKTKTPPSGDKHDYYSIGPYWWPDPKSKTGLPYVRRDGETNPERKTDAFDNTAMGDMAKAVEALTLSGFFDGKQADSTRAAHIIRHWFLDGETRMNPNLDFAQSIPGRTDGRGIGIIDTYRLKGVVESALLLERSGTLTPTDMTALRTWFADYALWLVRSDNGKEERMATNNHGIYYDAQLAQFAAFAGDTTVLPKILDGVVKKRIPSQIDRKGRMPRELKRTRSFHYTAFTQQGLIDLADMGRCSSVDVYGTTTGKHGTLTDALSFQAGYVGRLSSWRYKTPSRVRTDILFDNLCRANATADDPEQLDVQSEALRRLRRDHGDRRVLLTTNNCAP